MPNRGLQAADLLRTLRIRFARVSWFAPNTGSLHVPANCRQSWIVVFASEFAASSTFGFPFLLPRERAAQARKSKPARSQGDADRLLGTVAELLLALRDHANVPMAAGETPQTVDG